MNSNTLLRVREGATLRVNKGIFVVLICLVVTVLAGAIIVTDATGLLQEFTKKPTRIVAAVPSDAEMLFDLGLGDSVVGVNDWAGYPNEVTKIEKIGGSPLNLEKIIALKPDLVLANAGLVPKEIEQLRKLGVAVLAINPTDLSSTLDSYLLVGKVCFVEERANELVQSLKDRQNRLKLLAKKPKVFVEIWHDPLMTAGKGSLWDSLINTAGGENIGALGTGAYPVFSIEELLKQNPDLVILTNYNLAEAKTRTGYTTIKERLIEIDPGLFTFPTKRLWDGLEVLYGLFEAKQ